MQCTFKPKEKEQKCCKKLGRHHKDWELQYYPRDEIICLITGMIHYCFVKKALLITPHNTLNVVATVLLIMHYTGHLLVAERQLTNLNCTLGQHYVAVLLFSENRITVVKKRVSVAAKYRCIKGFEIAMENNTNRADFFMAPVFLVRSSCSYKTLYF